MKNVASFIIDNKGNFQFGANAQKAQIRVVNLQDVLINDLIVLAKKEGLIVTLQGGLTITEEFKVIAPIGAKKAKK